MENTLIFDLVKSGPFALMFKHAKIKKIEGKNKVFRIIFQQTFELLLRWRDDEPTSLRPRAKRGGSNPT